MTKEKAIQLLREKKFPELTEIAKRERGLFRVLLSLVYNREDIISWRAIEAIGLIAGEISKNNPLTIRALVQKILWMMREESGNNPWSAPEILGEIVRNNPDEFSDVASIIASFHEEDMLRKGVLRAIERITKVRPDLISLPVGFIRQYLTSNDPVIRFYAILIAGNMRLIDELEIISKMREDLAVIEIYENSEFLKVKVGDIAGKVFLILEKR